MLRVRVFADRFMVDGLSQVMECVLIRYLVDEQACYEVVAYAYKHLPKGNIILTTMVHSHCHYFDGESDNGDYNDEMHDRSKLPHDFLIDVMVRYMEMKMKNKGVEESLTLSDFHKHSCKKDTLACKLAWSSLTNDFLED
jgi:hypothetical protein